MKSFVGVLGEVFRGFLTTDKSTSHHQKRRLQKRRLCFETLENREFLSAGSFDNNDYANNYAEDFYNNSAYYSSGGSDACCECCEDDDKFCECDSHEKDNWQVTLSGPALVNGQWTAFAGHFFCL
jgi:hypothetical protein